MVNDRLNMKQFSSQALSVRSNGTNGNSTVPNSKNVYFIYDYSSSNLSFQYCQEISESRTSPSFFLWKQRILRLSNWASILCVIDCTILPIITLILSITGMITGNNHDGKLEWLHDLGHSIALYFVIPVGSLTTICNYNLHHNTSPLLTSFIGLTMIALSNICHDDYHMHSSTRAEGEWFIIHAFHEGPGHRLFNVLGCVLQLWANHQSQQLHVCQDKYCKERMKVVPHHTVNII